MFEVLLVEDMEGDVLLVQEAVADLDMEVRLHVVRDGVDALAFLKREGPYMDRPAMGIVLMDANTPRRNAVEVLRELRSDSALKSLPVVVFSSSAASHDAELNLAAGADAYVTKPLEFEAFMQAVQGILRHWMGRASA
ncbi:response regulator [Deinococcus hopiensis]|uniref:Response regulators consisting of a CheY-like receiver domain and a winged-helix DNA-binding domain n=1 Tax=Deinococcus hopiensis KR-140 TaxID=695939 RepID=A0A1W1VWE0_9DEIO|nr:response regulator [Deinococcus hopiensis]SMB97685.1 Response regulators consisting of a CheY-like receiver domain and a winged-helix DNA-binding domain [Deinococcus hopiensis KR-140]